MVGSHHQPICIPARSCKFLVGTAKEVPHKGSFMMEGTQDGNLPSGVAVNNTYVQPTKSGRITVCLQNTNDHNVWIRQPLYAGDLWDMDKEDWEYEPVLVKDAKTNNITVKFQQVPPEHIREEIFSQAAEMFGPDKTDKDKETETKDKGKGGRICNQHQRIAQIRNNLNLVLVRTLVVPTLILKRNLSVYSSQSTSGRHHSAESSKVAL